MHHATQDYVRVHWLSRKATHLQHSKTRFIEKAIFLLDYQIQLRLTVEPVQKYY